MKKTIFYLLIINSIFTHVIYTMISSHHSIEYVTNRGMEFDYLEALKIHGKPIKLYYSYNLFTKKFSYIYTHYNDSHIKGNIKKIFNNTYTLNLLLQHVTNHSSHPRALYYANFLKNPIPLPIELIWQEKWFYATGGIGSLIIIGIMAIICYLCTNSQSC